MSRDLTVVGVASVVWLVFVLLGSLGVFAQIVAPTPCAQSLECLRHRVKDLEDYRAFLEDQLALAKALNEALQAQLQACPRPELPPREDGTKSP